MPILLVVFNNRRAQTLKIRFIEMNITNVEQHKQRFEIFESPGTKIFYKYYLKAVRYGN